MFSNTGGGSGTHESFDAEIAIIDRDESTISEGLAAYLGDTATLVDVDDNTQSIQDALAQSKADAVIIVDEGFGESLMKAAHDGADVPEVHVAYGTDMQQGALAMSEATGWLSLVGRAAALDTTINQATAVENANVASTEKAVTELTEVPAAEGGIGSFANYLGFNTYALFATIVVCVGLVMTRFRSKEVRQRSEASPRRPSRISSGVILASLVLVVITWAWVGGLGVVCGSSMIAGAPTWQLAVCLASMFAYCLTPLALAFTISQFNVSEQLLNAIGNIFGLVCAFFSGAWIALDLVGPTVREIAKFTPAYWFNDALTGAISTQDWSIVANRIGTDFFVMLLFAAVTGVVGVAVSRVHTVRSVGSAKAASTEG